MRNSIHSIGFIALAFLVGVPAVLWIFGFVSGLFGFKDNSKELIIGYFGLWVLMAIMGVIGSVITWYNEKLQALLREVDSPDLQQKIMKYVTLHWIAFILFLFGVSVLFLR